MDSALVVKRTFLELETDSFLDSMPFARRRADTDTVVDYGVWAKEEEAEKTVGASLENPMATQKGNSMSAYETSAGKPLSDIDSASWDADELSQVSEDEAQLTDDERPSQWQGRPGPPGCHLPVKTVKPAAPLATLAPAPLIYVMVPVARGPLCVPVGTAQSAAAPRTEAPQQRFRASKAEAGRKPGQRHSAQLKATTIVLRHLPRTARRATLLQYLTASGCAGLCDFLYLPVVFKTSEALGYAVINFTSAVDAEVALSRFNGMHFEGATISAEWSKTHNGLQSLLQRYQHSPIMDEGVPDEYKPVCLSQGQLAPFPLACHQ